MIVHWFLCSSVAMKNLHYALLFQPGNHMFRRAHRREAALTYQAPVIEKVAIFDLAQCYWLSKFAHKSYIHYPTLAVGWVWTRLRGHTRLTDNGRFTRTVIDQHIIAGAHSPDCL